MKYPKLSPLTLSLLGGLTVVPLAAQATNIRENLSETEDSKTYSYTVGPASDSHYIHKFLTDATKANIIFEVDDSNLEFTRDHEGREKTYGALGLTVDGDSSKFAGPITVDFNLKNFASISNSGGKETEGVFLRTSYKGENLVTINSNTKVTGSDTRTITAVGEALATDPESSVSAFNNLYWAPGSHNIVIDGANTTYKASSVTLSNRLIGIYEDIQHRNNTINFEFKSGTVDVNGRYSESEPDSKVSGIKVTTTNIRNASPQEDTPTSVDLTVSGGLVKAYNGRYAEGVAVELDRLLISSSNINISGGNIEVAAGRDARRVVGSYLEVRNSKDGNLTNQVATNTQSGGTITVNSTNVESLDANLNTFGLATITQGNIFKSKVVQSGGQINLVNTKNTNNVAAALYSVSGQDAEIVQGATATSTVTGTNNAVAFVKSTNENVLVDLAGHGEAANYGIYTETATDKLSTINIRGTAQLFADTAVYNNEGNSNITVEEGATIGKAEQKTKFDLGLGDDNLTLNNVNLDHISELDGGQDADVTTDFDTLSLSGYTDLEIGEKLKNWESVKLHSGTYDIKHDLTVGQGKNSDKVGGIEVASDAELSLNRNRGANVDTEIVGDIINNGNVYMDDTNFNGDFYNKNKLFFNKNISGKLINEGRVDSMIGSVQGGIYNKAGATFNSKGFVFSKLDADIENEGEVFFTDTRYHGNIHNRANGTLSIQGVEAYIDGEINNEGILNSTARVNNLYMKTVTVNNTGTVNIKAGKFTGIINNDNLLNIENDTIIEGVVNQNKDAQNLYLKDIKIQGNLNNKGLVTVVGNATVDHLNNKVDGTLVVNSGAVLKSVVNNEGVLTLENGSIVQIEVNNKSGGQANLNQAKIMGTLNNESTLTLEDGFTLEGHLNNKANGIATLNQATITRSVTNEGNLTVASNLNLGEGLYNEEGGLVNINSNFTGYFSNEGRAIASNDTFFNDVRNSGTLSFNGDAKILGNLSNINLLDLRNSSPDHFNTLTVEGDFSGGGVVKLNAKLAGDADSEHDTLIIKGNVHGTTKVDVVNLNDVSKARQTDKGIRLVELADSSIIDEGKNAFTLAHSVEAGAYEYNELSYTDTNGKKGFYLQSNSTGGKGGSKGNGGTGSNSSSGSVERGDSTIIDKDGRTVHLLRPAAAAYVLNQQINAQALADLNDGLHQRSGEQRAETNYLNQNQSWVRTIGTKTKVDANNLGSTNNHFGLQVGYDFKTTHQDDFRNRAGVFASYSKVNTTLTDSHRKEFYIPGKVDTHLATLAIYNTSNFGNGYVDLVGGLHFLHSDYEIFNGGEQNAFGANLSVEAGYNLDLGNHFFVEPQVQLSYQGTRYAGFKDAVTAIKGYTHQSLRPRAGFRLGYHDLAGTNLWLHANLETELLKTAKLTIGSNVESVDRAAKVAYDLGLNGQVALNSTTVLYGSAQYKGAVGQSETLKSGAKVKATKLSGFGAEAGLRFTW